MTSSPQPKQPNSPSPVLQRILRLSTSEVVRKGQLSAIDQGVISAGNFLASILMARFVAPTEYGVYTVGFLAVLFVRSAQEGLIIQPVNALGASLEEPDYRRYISATAVQQVLLGLACAAGAMALGWTLTATGNDTAGPLIFALWFSFLTWQLQEFIRRIFYTRGQVGLAVANTIIQNTARLAIILVLGASQHMRGIDGLNAMGWGALAALAFGLWSSRRLWTWRGLDLRDLLGVWRENWDFGRWTLGGTVLNWIAVQLYPILTAGMISFAAAGAYQALQNLVAPVHVILRASDTFMTPRIAKRYARDGFPSVLRMLRLTYLVVGIPVAILLVAAVEFRVPLLHLIRGDTYQPYNQGILLFAVFYGLWFAYWPLQTVYKAIRFTRPIFVANALAIGSMVVFGIWAIQRWGVYGTIAGQALNALIVNVVLWGAWVKRKM